jgi:1,4-alpha-glucan branching enzyme
MKERVQRRWCDQVAVGLIYAFSESFVLRLNHDEVHPAQALGPRADAWYSR